VKGETFSFFAPPDIELTSRQVAELQSRARVTFNAEQLSHIAAAMTSYAESAAAADAQPKSSEVTRLIEKVADGMLAALQHLTTDGSAAAEAAASAIAANLESRAALSEVHGQISSVYLAAHRALVTRRSKKGAPGQPFRTPFICRLHQAYTAAGGKGTVSNNKGTPSGAFLQFVLCAASIAGHVIPDRAALDAIPKALSELRTRKRHTYSC
jgi:hypothetical protein